jgi:hypothetical protein
MLEHEGFEIVTLTPSGAGAAALPDAFFAAHQAAEHSLALVLGVEHRDRAAYRACLAGAIARAEALGLRHVRFGMGAPLEKRRFGARAVPRKVWFQARDHFHADVLALLAGDAGLRSASRETKPG